jgi:hypothetical protein
MAALVTWPRPHDMKQGTTTKRTSNLDTQQKALQTKTQTPMNVTHIYALGQPTRKF